MLFGGLPVDNYCWFLTSFVFLFELLVLSCAHRVSGFSALSSYISKRNIYTSTIAHIRHNNNKIKIIEHLNIFHFKMLSHEFI